MINRFVTTYLSILNEQNQTQIFDYICQKLAYQDNDVQIAKTYFINLLEHYKCKFPNQFKNIILDFVCQFQVEDSNDDYVFAYLDPIRKNVININLYPIFRKLLVKEENWALIDLLEYFKNVQPVIPHQLAHILFQKRYGKITNENAHGIKFKKLLQEILSK